MLHLDSSSKRSIFTGASSSSSTNCHHSSCVSELHFSIIPHILVKLPIKTIIICKCVCKSWNKLILDPYFTNLYSNTCPFTPILLLQNLNLPIHGIFRFLEIGKNGDVIRTPFNLDPLVGKHFVKRLVGSCNGLLCIVVTPYLKNGQESVFVINPLTGESLKISQVVKRVKNSVHESYALGSTVDGKYYKIIRINVFRDANEKLRFVLKIITIGVDDEWRDFDDHTFPWGNFCWGGVALSGALHWVDIYAGTDSIYAFDIAKEIGHIIPGPPRVTFTHGYIHVWNGHLSLTHWKELQFDIWTMRQYGVAESWTKDIVLTTSPLNIYWDAYPRTRRRNGDLLLSVYSDEDHESLISFDLKTKNVVKFEEVFSDLIEYSPCFSSLSGMTS